MKRKMSVVIGDYSQDGHNQFDTYLVKIKGKDVSDEALQDALDKSNHEFGITFHKLFENYEDSQIDSDLLYKFVCAGFDPESEAPGPFFYWEEGVFVDQGESSAMSLIMWYIGRNIKDFEWKSIDKDYPALIGGWSPVVRDTVNHHNGFGYGLYSV